MASRDRLHTQKASRRVESLKPELMSPRVEFGVLAPLLTLLQTNGPLKLVPFCGEGKIRGYDGALRAPARVMGRSSPSGHAEASRNLLAFELRIGAVEEN